MEDDFEGSASRPIILSLLALLKIQLTCEAATLRASYHLKHQLFIYSVSLFSCCISYASWLRVHLGGEKINRHFSLFRRFVESFESSEEELEGRTPLIL